MKRSSVVSLIGAAVMIITCCLLMAGCDKDNPTSTWWVRNANARIGDVNLNDQEFEIADYVLFSRYFLYGESVFNIDRREQIANTDIDRNGTPLSICDLVRFYLVVIGDDSDPYDLFYYSTVDVTNDGGILRVDGDVGAALLIVEGEVSPFNYTEHLMGYFFDGTNTRIILYGDYDYAGTEFSGWFINIGSHKLLHLEMATAKGNPLRNRIVELGIDRLSGGYPNPFVDSVHVAFFLLSHDSAAMRIRDALGSTVFDTIVTRDTVHGVQTLTWDARTFPDGLYVAELDVQNKRYYSKLVKDKLTGQ